MPPFFPLKWNRAVKITVTLQEPWVISSAEQQVASGQPWTQEAGTLFHWDSGYRHFLKLTCQSKLPLDQFTTTFPVMDAAIPLTPPNIRGLMPSTSLIAAVLKPCIPLFAHFLYSLIHIHLSIPLPCCIIQLHCISKEGSLQLYSLYENLLLISFHKLKPGLPPEIALFTRGNWSFSPISNYWTQSQEAKSAFF